MCERKAIHFNWSRHLGNSTLEEFSEQNGAGWKIHHERIWTVFNIIYSRISSRNCKKHGKTRSVGRQVSVLYFHFLVPFDLHFDSLVCEINPMTHPWDKRYIYLHLPLTSTIHVGFHIPVLTKLKDSQPPHFRNDWRIPTLKYWGESKKQPNVWSFSVICLL